MKVTFTPENFKFVKPSLPDSRDIIYKASANPVDEYSLEEFRGPILNQGNYGACTGFGTAGMLRSFFKRITNEAVDFSPWYIYYNARTRSGWSHKDEGAFPREIFNSLIKDGVVEANNWDPRDPILTDPPTFDDSLLIKFKGYKRFNKQSVEQLQQDLSNFIGVERLPIGLAINVWQNATEKAGVTGVFGDPTNDISVGGHWIYSDKITKDGIVIVNSWSRDWGKNGTALLPWEYTPKFIIEAWGLDPELP